MISLSKPSKCKMINFDNYTNENKTDIIQIGHALRIVHTEYSL